MKLIAVALFALVALPASVIDLRTRRVPNVLVLAGFVGAAAAALVPPVTLISAFLGALAALALFLSVWYLSRGGMGMGDVKFASVVGAVSGIAGLAVALFVSALLALLVALGLILADRRNARRRIPFVPFLSAGGLAALLSQGFHWPALLTGGIR